MTRLIFVAALLVASACQLTLPGSGGDAPTPGAAVEAIETTVLAPASGVDDAPNVVPAGSFPEVAASPDAPKEPAEPATPTTEPVVKSVSQLACEKKDGRFVTLTDTGAQTCQLPTSDGGKVCSKQGDCEGSCLARSRSCSPITPLLGCNDVLLADGTRSELCIN